MVEDAVSIDAKVKETVLYNIELVLNELYSGRVLK